MFKVTYRETTKLNRKVNRLKQDNIKEYKHELAVYLRNFVVLSLKCLYTNSCTDYSIELNNPSNPVESQLVQLINQPPKLGDLSLPSFLGQVDSETDKVYDIIDLPKGYLYVSLPENNKMNLQYHIDKPNHANPYLDVNKSFKTELPTLLRDNGVVMSGVYSLSRIISLIKML